MKRFLLAGLALALALSAAQAAPLESPCTQAAPGSARCDPVNSGNPLPVTGSVSVGATAATPCGVLTRPADTTAYALNDLIASSTTAGSVVVPSCSVARIAAGSGLLTGFRLTTNVTTGWDTTQIKVTFWSTAPTYTNGDNGAYAVATGAAGYLGDATITLRQFGDGASGRGAMNVGNFMGFKLSSGQIIFWDAQILGAATPISGQTFTLTPEDLQD